MSVWLSSANKVMDSARGQTTAAAKCQVDVDPDRNVRIGRH
jgi:hypothetical protein